MKDETPSEIQEKPTDDELRILISIRAHEIYECRGCEGRHALDDWLQAEREILPHLTGEEAVQEGGPGLAGPDPANGRDRRRPRENGLAM